MGGICRHQPNQDSGNSGCIGGCLLTASGAGVSSARLRTLEHREQTERHTEIKHVGRLQAKRTKRMLLTEEILDAVFPHVTLPKPLAVDSVDLRVCQYLTPTL